MVTEDLDSNETPPDLRLQSSIPDSRQHYKGGVKLITTIVWVDNDKKDTKICKQLYLCRIYERGNMWNNSLKRGISPSQDCLIELHPYYGDHDVLPG